MRFLTFIRVEHFQEQFLILKGEGGREIFLDSKRSVGFEVITA